MSQRTSNLRRKKKPQGQITRGKTASNRLRRADNFVLLYEPSLLTRTDGLFAESLFIDLGYGFDPRTTLESAERFRRVNPNLKILGVEIDKERVAAAQPFADERTFFRLGGFNLPLQAGETVRLIRAFNVLRVAPGEEVYDFIETWKRSAAETSAAKTFGLKQWFAASAERLAGKGFKVDLHKKWTGKDWLIWYR